MDRAAAPADGGSPITSYDLRWSTDQATWTTQTGIADPQTVSGLAASTTYYVQTRAVNAVGAGAWSPSGSAATQAAATAPVISGLAYDAVNDRLTMSVDQTDTTIYWLLNTSTAALTGAQIEAATGATASGSFAAASGAVDYNPPFEAVADGTYTLHVTAKKAGLYATEAQLAVTFSTAAPSLALVADTDQASSSSVSSHTLAIPAGAQAGDLLVVAVIHRGDKATTLGASPAMGAATTLAGNATNLNSLDIYSRVLTGGEGNITVNTSFGACASAAFLYRGASGLGTPVGANNAFDAILTAPAITVPAGALALRFYVAQTPTITAPGEGALLVSNQATTGVRLLVEGIGPLAAGSTGTRDATMSGSEQSLAATLAINP